MKTYILTAVLILIVFFGSGSSVLEAAEPAQGKGGMVSSAHPIATQAGIDILKNGGNAFDAAVAVASVLNVVEPMMSGMGGYGTILIYDAQKKQIRFLDSSGKIPVNTDSNVFRKPFPGYKENREGPKAISTPGNVNAWEAMSGYGKLKWERLFKRAIKLAEEGFLLDKRTARFINSEYDSFPDHAKKFYGPAGRPLQAGERLIQKDLAATFRLIASGGAKEFYHGKTGRTIAAEMRRMGSFLSLKDLQNDKAEWWEPVSIPYRDCVVYTASPPSTAFPSLIRLGIMSRFDVNKAGHNSIDMLHTFIEVTKIAFRNRLQYAGDPEVNPPPLKRLLSEKYWQEQADSIDAKRSKPFTYPGLPGDAHQHTTHFVTADRWGNIVSATQTLGKGFGSRIMPKGTGIWLNNSLAYCTFEPAGNPMDAHPGRRKLSGDCPTIIVKNGKPWVALGTPGGHTIGQTVPQMVMNLIDFNMDIQEAIDAPRVSFLEPDEIAIEDDIPKKVRDALAARGHKLRVIGRWLGCAHGLVIEYDKKGNPIRFYGAADSRGIGLAKGF